VIKRDSRVAFIGCADVSGSYQMIRCDRCNHRSYVKEQFTSSAVIHFVKAGWRRIEAATHCPDCVAEIIPDEDMR
jgi:hypothetical protein